MNNFGWKFARSCQKTVQLYKLWIDGINMNSASFVCLIKIIIVKSAYQL